MMTIAGGTAIGQLLALGCAPLLSRLYSPADFGVFAVLSALAVTIGTVGALRFELAIPLPKAEMDAHALMAVGFACAIVMSITLTGAIALFGQSFATAFEQPALMPWLWAVPLIGLLMATFMLLNQLAIRDGRFSAVGRRNALQSTSMVVTQVLAGTAGVRPGGLMLGLGFGNLVGTVSLTPGARLLGPDARAGRRWRIMRAVMRRYYRFPLLLAPSGLLNVLGLQLPLVLVAYWFGGAVAGWLGLTQRVLGLPVTLVGTAIAQVYLSELAKAVRLGTNRAKRLFLRTTVILVAAATLMATVLYVAGPWLFDIIFGPEWLQSGKYAQALAIGIAAQLIAVPLSQTLVVLEHVGLQFAWDAVRLVINVSAVAGAVWLGFSALETVWALGASMAVLYIVSWLLNFRAISRRSEGAT